MKAKEYANKYKENPSDEVLGKIAIDMLVEIKTISELRHAKSGEALISILNEMINKWRAFALLVKDIGEHHVREDGLKLFIIKDFPFIPVDRLK